MIYAAITYTLLTLLYTVVTSLTARWGGVVPMTTQRISLHLGACAGTAADALYRTDDASGETDWRRE